MSFTPFYLIGGGAGSADINAGSSIGAAQATPATGGSWTNATNTFVATGGTPFAATVIGDYVSVYADGATVTTYVAQVTTVVSNVSVILSATIKYGTAPTDGAANRSAVAGGSWSTEQVLAAGGLATTTAPQSTKINIKQATYTITASRAISIAGTTTKLLWFSGYNTTPGDLDADTTNSLSKPTFAFNSTFSATWSGAFQIISSISFTGSRSGNILGFTGTNLTAIRVRGENTSSNTAAGVVGFGSTGSVTCLYCWFKCPTTATANTGIVSGTGSGVRLVGCVMEGGGQAGASCDTNWQFLYCIALNNTGKGFAQTGGASSSWIACTVYNSTSDGINISVAPTTSLILGCLFSVCGGYGINQSSGANVGTCQRSCNDFYACTSNPENGFGDSPAFFQQTDGSSPVTSATDMTPIATSNAFSNGFPGIFENETFKSYAPIGAVTALAGSGGGAVAIFGG